MADGTSYIIRTNQGDKGPFSPKQITQFLQAGKLKPNVKVMNTVSQQAVLVATIARQVLDPDAPDVTPAKALPPATELPIATDLVLDLEEDAVAEPPTAAQLPPDAGKEETRINRTYKSNSGRLISQAVEDETGSSRIVDKAFITQQSQRERTTAAFADSEIGLEIASAEDIDLTDSDIERMAPSPTPVSNRTVSGDEFDKVAAPKRDAPKREAPERRQLSNRRSTVSGGSSGRRQSVSAKRPSQRSGGGGGRRRTDQGRGSRRQEAYQDYDDDDYYDDEDYDERPRRRNRKAQRNLVMSLIIVGVVVFLGVLGLIAWKLAPVAPKADRERMLGGWHVDNLAMIEDKRELGKYSFARFQFTRERVTMPDDGVTYNYKATTISSDGGTKVSMELSAADRSNRKVHAWFERDRFWIKLIGNGKKHLILRSGPPPGDPAASMERIRQKVGEGNFTTYAKDWDAVDAPVPTPPEDGGQPATP